MTPATLNKTTSVFALPRIKMASSQRNTQALRPQSPYRNPTPCGWLQDTLGAIASLPYYETNWDSYGALPVDINAGQIAKHFSHQLSCIADMEGLPPTVSATSSGEVLLCWDVCDQSLDVTINQTGLMSYVYLDHQNSENDLERSTRDFNEIARILTQLPR